MMDSVDVMMDDMGFHGGLMDGFLAGYTGRWSYDTDVRWDGHSAEINGNTKTITRKMGSVLLLSATSGWTGSVEPGERLRITVRKTFEFGSAIIIAGFIQGESGKIAQGQLKIWKLED